MIKNMMDLYGFTEEALLLADAYEKFDAWLRQNAYDNCIAYDNREKMHMFFTYLSALNPNIAWMSI